MPCGSSASIARNFSAIVSSASSQEMRANSPLPFGPILFRGKSTRSLCTKVARYLERTYSKDRVLFPRQRIGPKGKGEFARISWDEALDTIAEKFRAVEAEDPQGILPYDYAGT